MARVIGVDLGSKRVGVAASDRTRTLASPVDVLQRSGDRGRDHRALLAIVEEYEADAVIVGLPIGLDGREGAAAKLVRAEIAEMAQVFSVPIHVYDERFTTATAHASMMERKMKADARRRVVDKVAAAVLLQGFLDQEAIRAHREAPSTATTAATDETTETGETTETAAVPGSDGCS